MRQEIHVASFVPQAEIPANTIVMIGTADRAVAPATAGNGFGVANDLGAAAGDDNVDVVLSGIANVKLGGSVARGAYVISDAQGQAVTATGTPIDVIGMALETGVAGDIRPIFLMQHSK